LGAAETVPLLSVENVTVRLHGARQATHQIGGRRILNEANLSVRAGAIVGLIGETGSGKTTLARAIVGLVPTTSGRINFAGTEVSSLRRRALRAFRRRGEVQFVFQDPLRSLDPDQTVGQIVGEGLDIQGELSTEEREHAIDEALTLVGLDPAISLRRPGQISGGQRQRVSIARAVVMRPRLVICDEPVSALDASTRNYVLKILSHLRDELGLALLIISHDLASLAGVADSVAVLYQGHIVEEGPLEEVFAAPGHPYTALLIASSPSISRTQSVSVSIEDYGRGEPDAVAAAEGCPFATRCPYATEICQRVTPKATAIAASWSVCCHHVESWRSTRLAPPAAALRS
jgi:oligopeptide/dipeptide ABC transporter ATP-binding protein